MQILITLAFAAVAVAAVPPPVDRSDSLPVRAVIDGNTIDVARVGRVRLLGIAAPKVGRGVETPFAREARDKLASLVLGHWVHLERDAPDLDANSRRAAYVVRDDGLFVNAVLVREGLARVSTRGGLS